MSSMDAGAFGAPAAGRIEARSDNPAYQAYQLLHWGFVLVPLIAGADKFLELLADWDKYLAPVFPNLLHISAEMFMRGVGVIEIIAAIIVAAKPRIGAYIVGLWLLGIVINLAIHGGYWDILLRDLGLAVGAFALARLGEVYDRSNPPS